MGVMSLAYLASGCTIPWRLTPDQVLATITVITRVTTTLAILTRW